MAKKLYTIDYNDESFPQIVEFVQDPSWVVPGTGMTLLEAKDELYRWAANQAEHYRMIARAALAARKEDVEAGSIYTDRASLTAKRQRAQAKKVVEVPAGRTPEELDDAFETLAS
jgi:hypothetical protein